MNFNYFTDRLQLKILTPDYADEVLRFYTEGRNEFEAVEPDKMANFYTRDFHELSLQGELNGFLAGTYIRYYFVLKDKPDEIIGTASFSHIMRGSYNSCILGYKLLPKYQKQGYALEAVSELIQRIFNEMHLHRIEAYTLPGNFPSISLLTRLGFYQECVAKSVILIGGKYRDHNKFVLINPGDKT